jgi:peptidyl-prolyl cis-trans isomerase B (cyclophilin B)
VASGRERYERTAAERKRVRTAQREAQRRARRRRQALVAGSGAVVLVIVAVIVLVAITGSSKKTGVNAKASTTPTAATTASGSAAPAATPTGAQATNAAGAVCTYTPDPATETASGPGLPPDKKATGQHTLTIVYNVGTVVIKLNPKAPCTVNSFQWLASQHFFTDTSCHRLVTTGIYVLQCGDPTGTGSGGPGYTIPDEDLTDATYPAGEVAMANTGQAHTGGSQFFLVYKDSTGTLGPTYTPFGTITSGLDVIQKIAAKGSNNANGSGDGAPKEKVVIESFTIS